MTTAPGWYEAGTPGRVRWWDGTQWTEHESEAPVPAPAQTSPAQTPFAQAAAPLPGWYVTSAESARWWDGKKWTGSRTKNGTPGIDWSTTESVPMTFAMGTMFAALGCVQLVLGILSPGVAFVGAPTLLLAALWFSIGIQTSIVLRIPTPTSAPLMLEIFRPLPGEQEGPGAGWYPISATASRWWTGARWTQYTNSKFGIRPTFHGPQTKITLRRLAIGVFALAAIVAIIGIVFIIVGTNNPENYVASIIGWVMAIGGAAFAGLGALVLAMTKHQTRLLFPPTEPPRV
ncbi:DUF2510 domain-containing protein [Microbacterium sp. NPDC087665]|uniref:DUF2510 domain-containing protein n=1 Tax=Microbacterium sp. NPDC087665 TaxID=3364194 RepID=UPI00381AC8A1